MILRDEGFASQDHDHASGEADYFREISPILPTGVLLLPKTLRKKLLSSMGQENLARASGALRGVGDIEFRAKRANSVQVCREFVWNSGSATVLSSRVVRKFRDAKETT